MTMKADPQTGFWDHEIENREIEDLLEDHELHRPAAKEYNATHRKLKKELDGLEAGVRYRIGRFVVTPQPIAGGGFKIDKWTSQTYDVRALD